MALLFQLPHPAIPHLPICLPKTQPARKFAQFSFYLPNWSHFMARCSRGWHSCHVAGNMWHSTTGHLLGAQGKEQLSSCPGTHCSLMLRGNLPACALLHGMFHNNSLCIWGPALHFAWKINRFTGLSPPLTTSFVFFRAKSTTDWQGLPQKGERETL